MNKTKKTNASLLDIETHAEEVVNNSDSNSEKVKFELKEIDGQTCLMIGQLVVKKFKNWEDANDYTQNITLDTISEIAFLVYYLINEKTK